jgi:uncharacterized protein YdhG (YjbR/CyaY superfamily)
MKKGPIPINHEQAVFDWMNALQHPLKPEIELLRIIIKESSPDIQERIKWNAPSYYVGKHDILTFNHRMTDKVHLIFHSSVIEQISHPILEGEFKQRRMSYFTSLDEIENKREIIQSIIQQNLALLK